MPPDFCSEPVDRERLRYMCCGLAVLAIFALGGTSLASRPDGSVASEVDTAVLVDLPPEPASSAPKADLTEESVAKDAIPPAEAKPIVLEPDPIPKAPVSPAVKPDAILPPDTPKPVETPRESMASVPPTVAATAQPDGSETPAPEAQAIESQATRAAQARAISRWQNSLLTKLEAAKLIAAFGTGETGTVVVSFAIDDSGHLRRRSVSKSSGSRLLDDLAVRLLDAAAPFPKPPVGLSEAMLAFSIPIRFNPRR